jgi:hypothetical protein
MVNFAALSGDKTFMAHRAKLSSYSSRVAAFLLALTTGFLPLDASPTAASRRFRESVRET